MNKPKIRSNQFALIKADGATGHILTIDNEVYQNDEKEVFLIFDDINYMYEYIKEMRIINNSFEFTAFNNNYEFIEYFPAPKWQ